LDGAAFEGRGGAGLAAGEGGPDGWGGGQGEEFAEGEALALGEGEQVVAGGDQSLDEVDFAVGEGGRIDRSGEHSQGIYPLFGICQD
jgi:hypothetical protein